MNDALLERRRTCSVEFKTRRGQALVLNGVDFEIRSRARRCAWSASPAAARA